MTHDWYSAGMELLGKYKVKVAKVRKNMSGRAYHSTGEIKAPLPRTAASFHIWTHEIGHIANGRIKPRWRSEYLADQFSMWCFAQYGFEIPESVKNMVRYYMGLKLAKALNRKMHDIPPELEPFMRYLEPKRIVTWYPDRKTTEHWAWRVDKDLWDKKDGNGQPFEMPVVKPVIRRLAMTVAQAKQAHDSAPEMIAATGDPGVKYMGPAKAGGVWFKNYKTGQLYRVDMQNEAWKLVEKREGNVPPNVALKQQKPGKPKAEPKVKAEPKPKAEKGATRNALMKEAQDRKIKYFRILHKNELIKVLDKSTSAATLHDIQAAAIKRWKAGWGTTGKKRSK